ncbi:MAG: M20/M25/M40 family metallo-hydrolase [Treponema sp.]|jgi:carboxypeptidase PM20D1|nr:M20/M25/M40 family metallo-hydrolase [Treponema sp.]
MSDKNPSPEALARFGGAIALPTVSNVDYAKTDFAPFDAFKAYLKGAFPLFHKRTELTVVNNYALVYRWKGRDAGALPLLLCAHYDVVPVEAGTETAWTHPPFSGAAAEGRVWGRGALDVKCQITAQMEAAEGLMAAGFIPPRDIYFAYGHDEEVGGAEGAQKIAERFAAQGLRFEGVLDEGGSVITDAIKGARCPLALIGIAEKGHASYLLTVTDKGGHSSTPPAHSALGRLARLIVRVEGHPLPRRLTPALRAMLVGIKDALGGGFRLAVGAPGLFKPVILKALAKTPATNALTRTTFALTMAKASDAPNVLPQQAQALVNVRLLHGDSSESVRRYIEKLVGREATVQVILPHEPSKVSPADSGVFIKLKALVSEVFPGAIAAPYLVTGGTDARKYYAVSDNVYRFTPAQLSTQEVQTMHNTNESLSIENYGKMILFYRRFVEGE